MSVAIAKQFFDRMFTDEKGTYAILTKLDTENKSVKVAVSDSIFEVKLNVEEMPTDIKVGDHLYFHVAEVESVSEVPTETVTERKKAAPRSASAGAPKDRPQSM